eukprot:TRINITY_DN42746_c0_g2_i1.p1 TRINITY_DN42746_c0_g2~~TRINITY_DN42746_c0_g2_i1.p1  ORF type:complete len:751 (-),score=96.92 TRINITY_DN42746_c0_g2_i1:827-3079(-)
MPPFGSSRGGPDVFRGLEAKGRGNARARRSLFPSMPRSNRVNCDRRPPISLRRIVSSGASTNQNTSGRLGLAVSSLIGTGHGSRGGGPVPQGRFGSRSIHASSSKRPGFLLNVQRPQSRGFSTLGFTASKRSKLGPLAAVGATARRFFCKPKASLLSNPEESLEDKPIFLGGVHGPIALNARKNSMWRLYLDDGLRRSFVSVRKRGFSKEQSKDWFQQLESKLRWEQPKVRDRLLPRSAAWLTADGCSCRYCYGGMHWPSAKMESWFLEITDDVCRACGIRDRPNSCNANLYKDGSESVGWHADDEPLFRATHQDTIIVSLSLGASRTFEMRPNDQPLKVTRLPLEDGDLCTMEGLMQKHYVHRVPPVSGGSGARINLTWRWIRAHEASCSAAQNTGCIKVPLLSSVGSRLRSPRSRSPDGDSEEVAARSRDETDREEVSPARAIRTCRPKSAAASTRTVRGAHLLGGQVSTIVRPKGRKSPMSRRMGLEQPAILGPSNEKPSSVASDPLQLERMGTAAEREKAAVEQRKRQKRLERFGTSFKPRADPVAFQERSGAAAVSSGTEAFESKSSEMSSPGRRWKEGVSEISSPKANIVALASPHENPGQEEVDKRKRRLSRFGGITDKNTSEDLAASLGSEEAVVKSSTCCETSIEISAGPRQSIVAPPVATPSEAVLSAAKMASAAAAETTKAARATGLPTEGKAVDGLATENTGKKSIAAAFVSNTAGMMATMTEMDRRLLRKRRFQDSS